LKGKFFIRLIAYSLVGIVICSIWYLTPKRYAKTVDGVYYHLGEEGVIEHIKIHFDGKLRNHVNGNKTFHGAVKFEGNKLPQLPKDRTDLELHYNGDNFSTVFSGFRVIDARGVVAPDIYTYGVVYINDDFTAFTIKVFANDVSWSESDGSMITAPAKDIDEAMNKSEELIMDFELRSKD
jgi:hypothetical protein